MKITARAYNYIPSEEEEFMNTKQLEYFKNLLLNWEAELGVHVALCDYLQGVGDTA